MSVQGWFSNEEVTVAPGSSVTVTLTVHNLGDATDSFTIVPAGLTAAWTSVSKGNLTLFGDSQDFVDVVITPPALPTTSAGPNVFSVRIIPQADPDETIVVEAVVDVQPFDDRRVVALQPIQRARRRATFEFMVENHGNGLASCRLRLVDASGRVDGSFDPPAVGVAPGASSLVRLRARTVGRGFRRSTRTLDFEVEAEQPGHQPAAEAMALVQPPTVSVAAVLKTLAALAVVGGILAAWFWVVRPEIRDSAAREVGARVDELTADAPSPTVEPGATTTVPAEASGSGEVVDPVFFRLEVAAQRGQTADESATVAAGETIDLTDVRIENPFNDEGVATLAVNGDQVYMWSLANIRGQYFEPRITPLRLVDGDVVTFTVRCDEYGDEERNSCTNAVNLNGNRLPE